MIKKALKEFHENQESLHLYAEGMSALHRSGIFEILRLIGQPLIVHDGTNPNSMAVQAARSVGWNGAINTLLNFKEVLIDAVKEQANPAPGFSGLDAAVLRGDLLKEEADAIRIGKRPDTSIYKPKPVPTPSTSGDGNRGSRSQN